MVGAGQRSLVTRRAGVLAVVVVVAAVVVAAVVVGFGGSPGAGAPGGAEVREGARGDTEAPRLHGAGVAREGVAKEGVAGEDPGEPQPPSVTDLIQVTVGGEPAAREVAWDALLERIADGPFGVEDLRALLPRLLDLFERGTEDERALAERALTFLRFRHQDSGALAAALLPHLPRIHALVADGNARLVDRLAMLPLLAALGPAASETAPTLVAWILEILREQEEYHRRNPMAQLRGCEYDIQETLSRLGAAALPAILEGLRTATGRGAEPLHAAIREMGRDAEAPLRTLLTDPDVGIRAAAVTALLGHLAPFAEGLTLAQEQIRDPASSVRRAVIEALDHGESDAGPLLVSALLDPDPRVRAAALEALAHQPAVADAERPRLLEALRSGSHAERLGAMEALAGIGPAAVEAVPWILDLMGERSPPPRWCDRMEGPHRRALEAFGPAALRALVAAACGDVESRRDAAFEILAEWKALDAREVAPLTRVLALRQGVPRMRLAAILARVDQPEAAGILLQGLVDPDEPVRVAAAEGLFYAGERGRPGLDRLLEGLRVHERRLHTNGAVWRDEWGPFYAYYLALEAVGRHAPERMKALRSDPSKQVREVAARALATPAAR